MPKPKKEAELATLWPQKKTGIACPTDGTIMIVKLPYEIICPTCGRHHE